jgi:hypothetical protein
MGMVNMLVLYSGNDTKISHKCITGDVVSLPDLFTVIYFILVIAL